MFRAVPHGTLPTSTLPPPSWASLTPRAPTALPCLPEKGWTSGLQVPAFWVRPLTAHKKLRGISLSTLCGEKAMGGSYLRDHEGEWWFHQNRTELPCALLRLCKQTAAVPTALRTREDREHGGGGNQQDLSQVWIWSWPHHWLVRSQGQWPRFLRSGSCKSPSTL